MKKLSPFKLTTHFRGWSRVLAIGLGLSLLLNFAQAYSNTKLSSNLSTPRIVLQTRSGPVLPLASGAFVWNNDVARDFVKLFLPILYTFSPSGPPPAETWSPFINPQLLKQAAERFQKNQSRIQTDGLNQTLFIRESNYDPDTDTVLVVGELRQIDKNGQLNRSPMNLTVQLTTLSDPLNPYGHAIHSIR